MGIGDTIKKKIDWSPALLKVSSVDKSQHHLEEAS